MYVRDAKSQEEVWLLDWIRDLDLEADSPQVDDFVVAVDETTNTKAGFGRLREHVTDEETFCEITSVGVLPGWRSKGVGAHIVERLLALASDDTFEQAYVFSEDPEYFIQFGFTPISTGDLPDALESRLSEVREQHSDAISLRIDVDAFEMPDRLRERFKQAAVERRQQQRESMKDEMVEDFGIDTDDASYKYDI